jgi:hypothetical protein
MITINFDNSEINNGKQIAIIIEISKASKLIWWTHVWLAKLEIAIDLVNELEQKRVFVDLARRWGISLFQNPTFETAFNKIFLTKMLCFDAFEKMNLDAAG